MIPAIQEFKLLYGTFLIAEHVSRCRVRVLLFYPSHRFSMSLCGLRCRAGEQQRGDKSPLEESLLLSPLFIMVSVELRLEYEDGV